MPKMNVYFAKDGSIHIRWNISDGIPDHATLEKLAEAIKAHKKNPAPCGNTEQDGSNKGTTHTNDTTAE